MFMLNSFARAWATRLVIILSSFFIAPLAMADLVDPDPSIAPVEVVAIQLKALQFNDNPEPDFGIVQTWNFAHPRNRAATGPLPRFAGMIKGPGFSPMLNHARHEITPVAIGPDYAQFDVLLETTGGKILLFQWAVERVTSGEYNDCWMTVAVSMPRLAGQGS
ncbi:hypothetical protein N9W44_02135 [Alphaproteobacteria bacterium]|jgi:hypothetical protein|nr:hypothetical protein [Alphaproteobacteria bacterium]